MGLVAVGSIPEIVPEKTQGISLQLTMLPSLHLNALSLFTFLFSFGVSFNGIIMLYLVLFSIYSGNEL